eukprot:CAMPEP_0195639324 /NCGR_PEP_ID=MMETSP0815-20121206/25521_1 /TAXON_ID=97485 /ORGANISM="Prymnesium parvum, Strain Texoma1" /LENGTH=143 /DNA_ID=CAMNT_0040781851 /DNA_START=533 /DNA_END=967 /DNA_ORIENTATION=-
MKYVRPRAASTALPVMRVLTVNLLFDVRSLCCREEPCISSFDLPKEMEKSLELAFVRAVVLRFPRDDSSTIFCVQIRRLSPSSSLTRLRHASTETSHAKMTIEKASVAVNPALPLLLIGHLFLHTLEVGERRVLKMIEAYKYK